METIQLINSLIGAERKLKHAEERQINHSSEPYVTYLAAPQNCQKENRPGAGSQAATDFIKALTSIF